MASLKETFGSIADAIREKDGSTAKMTPAEMPARIQKIPSLLTEYTPAQIIYSRSTSKIIDVKPVVYTDFTTATSLYSCFNSCLSVQSLILPDGFGQAASNISLCFLKCSSLSSLHLPNGFGQAATSTALCFGACSALTDITGNPNFKTSMSFTAATNLTHDSLMVIINGLQTVTTTQKLTLGATNLAKLTDAEKKIATDKGWTLA